jgi:hypothetical protein
MINDENDEERTLLWIRILYHPSFIPAFPTTAAGDPESHLPLGLAPCINFSKWKTRFSKGTFLLAFSVEASTKPVDAKIPF